MPGYLTYISSMYIQCKNPYFYVNYYSRSHCGFTKKKKLLYGLYILKFDCYFRKNKSKNNKLLVFGNHLCNKRKVVMVLELAKS